MEKTYTISVFTENVVGMLNRITIIFTRRHLNIESITASESEVKDVYRYTIVVRTSHELVKKVIGQIEKLVEVLKAFVHEDSEIVHQEMALYKIKTQESCSLDIEKIINDTNARILHTDKQYLVIEKIGHLHEINGLFKKLQPYDILEFACSGRVAVTKPMKELSIYLRELEEIRNNRRKAVKKKNAKR